MLGAGKLLPERRGHVVTKSGKETVLPECGRPTVPGIISERSCAFYGARWMLAAIPDVIHLVHGPAGCAYYGSNVRRKSYRVFSTQLEERDIVFGAGEKLYRAILEAVACRPCARAVLVYATCASGLIGDDLTAICRRSARVTRLPVVPVNAPGFCGYSQAAGQDIAAGVLLEYFIGTGKAREPIPNGVNLLGEFDVMGDLGEIERLLQQLGLSIICSFSGRATTTAMAEAHRARLNIIHCRRTGQKLADAMQERFGIPQLKVSFFGFEETVSALRSIGKFFGLAGVEEIVERGRREAGEAAPFLRKLAGKRVALFFGASRMGSMAKAFAELGMDVVMIGSQFGCQGDYRDAGTRVRAGTVLIDDAPEKELEEFIRSRRPHLFVGGTKEKYLATKLGVPFLVFPQEMSPFAGFRGFVNLAREAAGLVGAPVWRLAGCEKEVSQMNEKARVAVASSDGITVNRHFGSAEQFLIFEIDKSGVCLTEIRKTRQSGSNSGEPDSCVKDGIRERLSLLPDCRGIICLRAGHCVRDLIDKEKIVLLETAGDIASALRECYRTLLTAEG